MWKSAVSSQILYKSKMQQATEEKEGCQRPVKSWLRPCWGPFSGAVIISLPSAVVLEWKPSVHTQAAWGAALQTDGCLQQNKLRARSLGF